MKTRPDAIETPPDDEACEDCGLPLSYPLCDECFETRWAFDSAPEATTSPLAALASRRR